MEAFHRIWWLLWRHHSARRAHGWRCNNPWNLDFDTQADSWCIRKGESCYDRIRKHLKSLDFVYSKLKLGTDQVAAVEIYLNSVFISFEYKSGA